MKRSLIGRLTVTVWSRYSTFQGLSLTPSSGIDLTSVVFAQHCVFIVIQSWLKAASHVDYMAYHVGVCVFVILKCLKWGSFWREKLKVSNPCDRMFTWCRPICQTGRGHISVHNSLQHSSSLKFSPLHTINVTWMKNLSDINRLCYD
jgi:hypothetical protein